MIDRAEETYKHLFPTESVKAEAFDKIAELFYNCNFGSTTKMNIETLMFSIYLFLKIFSECSFFTSGLIFLYFY